MKREDAHAQPSIGDGGNSSDSARKSVAQAHHAHHAHGRGSTSHARLTTSATLHFTDYHLGGVQAASILAPQFWLGYLVALPAGFAVAWPVNWWLLRSSVKKPCH